MLNVPSFMAVATFHLFLLCITPIPPVMGDQLQSTSHNPFMSPGEEAAAAMSVPDRPPVDRGLSPMTSPTTQDEADAIDRALAARRRRSSIPAKLGLRNTHRSDRAATHRDSHTRNQGDEREVTPAPAEREVTPTPPACEGDTGNNAATDMAGPSQSATNLTIRSEVDDAKELQEEMQKLQEEMIRYEQDRRGALRLFRDGEEVNPLDQNEKEPEQEYVWDGELAQSNGEG